jgi:hypothetical protein
MARSMIMIGAPTVAIAGLAEPNPRHVTLLDANSWAVQQLAKMSSKIIALNIDVLRDPLPPISAPVVITDAPWYPEPIAAFLWAASQLCELDGYVMASFPSIGTRPHVVEERESLISRAAENGLKCVAIRPGAITYETPPFERSAFRACGIMNVPADWRRGDFLLFRRISAHATSRPLSVEAGPEWVDIEIHGIRLKVRAPLPFKFDDPRLRPLIAGDVLPSVSRRDSRRVNADVWTPTNRIFSCRGRSVFVQIAHAIACTEEPVTAVTKWLGRDLASAQEIIIQEASDQLSSLVHRELAELTDLERIE